MSTSNTWSAQTWWLFQYSFYLWQILKRLLLFVATWLFFVPTHFFLENLRNVTFLKNMGKQHKPFVKICSFWNQIFVFTNFENWDGCTKISFRNLAASCLDSSRILDIKMKKIDKVQTSRKMFTNMFHYTWFIQHLFLYFPSLKLHRRKFGKEIGSR